jgi:hypothetical protein
MADSRKSVVLKLEAGMKTFTVKSSTFRILWQSLNLDELF